MKKILVIILVFLLVSSLATGQGETRMTVFLSIEERAIFIKLNYIAGSQMTQEINKIKKKMVLIYKKKKYRLDPDDISFFEVAIRMKNKEKQLYLKELECKGEKKNLERLSIPDDIIFFQLAYPIDKKIEKNRNVKINIPKILFYHVIRSDIEKNKKRKHKEKILENMVIRVECINSFDIGFVGVKQVKYAYNKGSTPKVRVISKVKKKQTRSGQRKTKKDDRNYARYEILDEVQ